MDRLKKYLREHEENLSADQVSDKVWDNVQRKITNKRSFFIFRRPAHPVRWAFATLILVFIFSCIYRIDRVETIGNLINFSLLKNNTAAILKVTFLEQLHDFHTVSYSGRHDNHVSFTGFIAPEKIKIAQIEKDVNQLAGVASVKIVAVKATINESLFSVAVHKAFKIHVDERRPGKAQIREIIQAELNAMGVPYVKVDIESGSIELSIDGALFSPAVPAIDPTVRMRVVPPPSGTVDTNISSRLPLDTVNPMLKDERLPVATILKPGKWEGELIEDTLTITFYEPEPSAATKGGWISLQRFKLSDLGLSKLHAGTKATGNVVFDLKRAAGSIRFKVIVLNTDTDAISLRVVQDAVGTYTFEEDKSFRDFLRDKGFDNLTPDLMLLFALTDIDKASVAELKEKGFANNLSNLGEYLKSKL